MKNSRKSRYFTYLTQKKVHFLQIIEKDSAGKDLKIQYYVVDACNGFQRQDKLYWISESQVVQKLNPPIEKRVGYRRISYIFEI